MKRLHKATMYLEDGDPEKARDLIEGGMDVNMRDDRGMTLLHLCARKGIRKFATELIDTHGADMNARWDATGATFMQDTDYGRRMNAQRQEWNNATPLMLAAASGFKRMVKLLLDRGADPTLVLDPPSLGAIFSGGGMIAGMNAGMIARQYGQEEVAQLITEHQRRAAAPAPAASKPGPTSAAEYKQALDAITLDAVHRGLMTVVELDVLGIEKRGGFALAATSSGGGFQFGSGVGPQCSQGYAFGSAAAAQPKGDADELAEKMAAVTVAEQPARSPATPLSLLNKVLAHGTGVWLTGLSKAPELNGKHGLVVGRCDASSGRYAVRVVGRAQMIRAKPSSLRLLNRVDKHAALADSPMALLNDDALTMVLAAVVRASLVGPKPLRPRQARPKPLRRYWEPFAMSCKTCRLFNHVLRERVMGAVGRIKAALHRIQAKKRLMLLQEATMLQEYQMSRPGMPVFEDDHPAIQEEPTHNNWAGIYALKLSEGESNMVEYFKGKNDDDELVEPRIPGGQVLRAPAHFKTAEREWFGGGTIGPFRPVNPPLQCFRIVRSYSEESLRQHGL